MKGTVEDRAREFVNTTAIDVAVKDFTHRDDWSSLAEAFIWFAQREREDAEKEAGKKAVVEFTKKVDEYADSLDSIPNAMERAYAEMFGSDL